MRKTIMNTVTIRRKMTNLGVLEQVSKLVGVTSSLELGDKF